VQITDELTFESATDLAALVARKQVSPVELLEHYLERIERINPSINAFVSVFADEARAAARESEERARRGEARPLEGVPIPIKDEIAIAGTRTGMGSKGTAATPETADAELVARLRNAGAVILGKTRLPEFGTIPSTEYADAEPCHNPWDLGRTPGGSSGGAAAALAAGLAPAVHGRDGGGSLRIPASCCGVFTVKPSRGRISLAPVHGEYPLGLVTDGFITRTVHDNAALLDAVSGYATGDPYWAPPPARPFVDEVGDDPGRLRIAWTATPAIPVPVHESSLAAIRDAAALCESLGHDVEEHTPPWADNDDLLGLFMQIWGTLIGRDVEELIAGGGDAQRIEPHNRLLWEQGKSFAATDLAMTTIKVHQFCRQVMRSWETYDVVLTPSLAELPLPLGEMFSGYADNPMAPVARSALFTPYTVHANLTGQPAVSLPLSWHDGLPVGVQAIGRAAGEATLLRLSAQIEAARPWADRHPALS
jgi:amidase